MKAKKRLRNLLLVLLCLVLLYIGARFSYGPLRYRTYYSTAQPLGAYQDVGDGFVPQGVTQDAESGAFLVCGYLSGDSPSRLYVYPPGGDVRRVDLRYEDGSDYAGHAGGLTAVGDWVYISNAHKLFCLPKADVLAAKDKDALSFCAAVDVSCNASFCSCDGQYLYVGEYHAKGYETDETHALTFGEEPFAALVFAYPVSENGALPADAAPVRVYAIPDAVQGFAADEHYAFLSRSAGFHPSSIESYTLAGEPDGSFMYEGSELPLVVLGKARLINALAAPHMSEDLEIRNGVLLIGFESCAKKCGGGFLPASVPDFVAFDLAVLR